MENATNKTSESNQYPLIWFIIHYSTTRPRVCVIALAITYVEPNGTCLQPEGLLAITKVYGNNIFQGFLKENNLGSKSNIDWCFEFLGFQVNFLTY
jgi:hypothetical protein